MTLREDWSKIIISSGILFLTGAIVVICYSYVNALFLATYPTSMLPYLYVTEGLVIGSILTLTASVLGRSSNKTQGIICFGAAIFILALALLLPLNIYWLPFAFCVALLGIDSLLVIISWGTVSAAFDVRSFKQLSNTINFFGNFGGALCGFSMLWVIKLYGTNILVYILLVLLVVLGILISNLTKIPTYKSLAKSKQTPFAYKLYTLLFLYTVIVTVVYVLVDFGFKTELARNLTKDGIAKFMSVFLALCNVVTLGMQIFGVKKIIDYFGVIFLLAIMPIAWILTSTVMGIIPNLIVVAIAAGVWSTVRYGYTNLGQQLAINILPNLPRQIGRFYLRSFAFPVGLGIGSLILWLTKQYLQLYIIAIAVVIICFAILWLVYKLYFLYKTTLKQEIKLKRFTANFLEHGINYEHAAQKLALDALKSTSIEQKQFGLVLLQQCPPTSLPSEVYRLIETDKTCFKQGIKLIYASRDKQAIPILEKLLIKTKDEEKLSLLFDAFAPIDPKPVLPQAIKFINTATTAPLIASSIQIILPAGNLSEIATALTKLDQMLVNTDENFRLAAAAIISKLPIADHMPYLKKLLNDPSERVIAKTMREISKQKLDQRILPEIINKLADGRVSYYSIGALLRYKNTIIPSMLEVIHKSNLTASRNAIKVMILLQNEDAYKQLLDLYGQIDVKIDNFIAEELALFMVRHDPNSYVYKKAKLFILHEVANIQLLRYWLKTMQTPEQKHEVTARILLAKTRCFFWFALFTNPKEVLRLLPILLIENSSTDNQQAQAFELLDVLANDRKLTTALKIIENKQQHFNETDALDHTKHYHDSWIKMVLANNYEELPMEDIQKVFLLRKTSLFSELPSEALFALAKETESVEMKKGDKIFSYGDDPNGLYAVMSGKVLISLPDKFSVELSEGDFFGELALIDDAKRAANATAAADGALLFLDRDIFAGLINDIPQVLKVVTKAVVGYLREQLDKVPAK